MYLDFHDSVLSAISNTESDLLMVLDPGVIISDVMVSDRTVFEYPKVRIKLKMSKMFNTQNIICPVDISDGILKDLASGAAVELGLPFTATGGSFELTLSLVSQGSFVFNAHSVVVEIV